MREQGALFERKPAGTERKSARSVSKSEDFRRKVQALIAFYEQRRPRRNHG